MNALPLFPVTAAAPVLIIAGSDCTEITVGEDPSIGATWPTTDFLVQGITPGGQLQKKAGTTFTFKATGVFANTSLYFHKGETVGSIQLVQGAASTEFFQQEE